MTPEEKREDPAVTFRPQRVVGPVLRKVDPGQIPPPLNREQRRRLKRKKRS